MLFKVTVLLALISSAHACCGLSFTTCCQGSAYAPPRIIGYERIPLYAKVPVQAASPPLPGYPVAPQAPAYVTSQPIGIAAEQPMVMSNYASPVGQPVVQSVMVHEVPAYVAATPTVVVQEVAAPIAPRVQYAPFTLNSVGGSNYGSGFVSNAPGGLDSNVVTSIDYNNPLRVPMAKSLKLRRAYLKQVRT